MRSKPTRPAAGQPETRSGFQAATEAAFARLPRRFRDMCGDVVIRVEDFADEATLEAMDLDSPFELLGLYHGVSLDKKSVMDVPYGPDMVFLYRQPILRYWKDSDDGLEAIIAHVLIHEIGHHFGLSDDDMERIEDAVRAD